MSNKNLFKEAIADAKAVREAALANAKAALEEALTPRLQSMLAARLNEMEYEEEGYMGKDEEMEEGFDTNSFGWDEEDQVNENGELEEDFDLSEILAELNEAKEKEEEKEEEAENIADMTIDDLKALIADIVSQETGGDDKEAGMEPMDDMGGEEPKDSDEIDLEELLAELDEMGNDDDDEMEEGKIGDAFKKLGKSISKQAFLMGSIDKVGDDRKKIKTSKEERQKDWEESNGDRKSLEDKGYVFATPHKGGGGFGTQQTIGESEMNEYMAGQESLIDLGKWAIENSPAVAKQLGQDAAQIGGAITGIATVGGMALTGALGTLISKAKAYMKSKSSSSDKGEMKEAIRTINTLRNELNEVNLLNAKLLYVNKIFKAKNLSESQKLKVIASFDKATTAKEAKVVFESLNYTLTTATPKQAIKESLGFASRAAGVAPRKAIVETNDAITRMQKLANIIK